MFTLIRKITLFYVLIMFILAFFSKPWLVDMSMVVFGIVELLHTIQGS